jgi:hypothetical protein
MAFLDEEFSVDTLPVGNNNFEPLPEGWYNATITGAEIKSTKAGDGKFIAVKYTITGPSHQGRVVFGNLNIKNASTKAEEIGRSQLGDIMRAIGLGKVSDTDQLIGGNLSIKLSMKTGEYAGNEVKAFRALNGAAPAPTSILSTPSSVKTAPAKAAPPWAKGR